MGNCLIDMGDVTRVKTAGGKIDSIGKGLTDFNGFDTGIFQCAPAIFGALERCAEESGDTNLSGAMSRADRLQACESTGSRSQSGP